MKIYAFKKGWDMVPKGKATEVKEEIKSALGISSDATYYKRMKGTPEPSVSEFNAITDVFLKYGISDPWGV